MRIDPDAFGADTHQVRDHLRRHGIEARPTWKPMHLQPVWAEAPAIKGDEAAAIFTDGLCLPSGSAMTENQVAEVAELVLAARAGR